VSSAALVVRVTLHEPRFHGRPDWPPAPARVFQALIAGASRQLDTPQAQAAFRWLEGLSAPTIAAPGAKRGAAVTLYVPNNDLDAKGGDPDRTPEIRTAKVVQPQLLLSAAPFLYVWRFDGSDEDARRLVELARGLYQLGRGVDMAFAEAAVVTESEADTELEAYPGAVYRPSVGAGLVPGAVSLSTPCPGTFESLERRYHAQSQRFEVEGRGKGARRVFVQPPKARFREVVYDSPPERYVFELRPVEDGAGFAAVALADAHGFTTAVRDGARERLVAAIGREAEVDGVLIGPRPGESKRVPTPLRARIIPLASIGHEHADPSIRRLVVEVPPGGPLPAGDLRWAFSGLVVGPRLLVESGDRRMLTNYLGPARRWQSLTAVALPASRRRIEPSRQREEAKGAPERDGEERAAVRAVRQALRHAGVRSGVGRVTVTREPTLPRGARAENFEAPPRFTKERLWHVDIELDEPINGPLVIGDGRFLGLGVMRPVREAPTIHAWRIATGLAANAEPLDVANHLRRAVLSLAGDEWGARAVPAWVSGHADRAEPATGHEHLSFLADLSRGRLLVVDVREGASRKLDEGRRRLARALTGLKVLRAGSAGVLELTPVSVDPVSDPLLRASRVWRTLTPYQVNRHARGLTATEAVAQDVRRSLVQLGLPTPAFVEVANPRAESGRGLSGDVVVGFATAIRGPLLLGKTRHKGGGAFLGVETHAGVHT